MLSLQTISRCLAILALIVGLAGVKMARGQDQLGMAFVSPADNTDVEPGEIVTIRLETVNGFKPTKISVATSQGAVIFDDPPFNASLKIPDDAIGVVQLFAIGQDASQAVGNSEPITLNVVPPPDSFRITIGNGPIRLSGPNDFEALDVKVVYANGKVHELTGSHSGTTYLSVEPEFATIDENGIVRPGLRDGRTTVTATHKGRSMFANVFVTGVNASPTFTGLYDQNTKVGERFSYTIVTEDAEGYIATLAAEVLPDGATFKDNGDGTGELRWTPTNADVGFNEVKIVAIDGQNPTMVGGAWFIIEVSPNRK